MPEGDTIHKLAAALTRDLVGRPLRAAWSREVGLDAALVGRRVVAAGAVGKHLLLRLDDPTVLRIHLGLSGRWHRLPAGARAPDGAWLTLEVDGAVHALTRPRALERLRARDLPTHPVLRRLGPDLALPEVPLDAIVARARAPEHAARDLAALLLCQRVAAGIGNVYKSELLFLHGLDPWAPASAVSDDALRAVYADAHQLLRLNLRPGPRNTTGRRAPRLWVYGAVDRPCPRCGGPIRHALQGAPPRRTWWCPACQRGDCSAS